jgi:hypothetical protein
MIDFMPIDVNNKPPGPEWIFTGVARNDAWFAMTSTNWVKVAGSYHNRPRGEATSRRIAREQSTADARQ